MHIELTILVVVLFIIWYMYGRETMCGDCTKPFPRASTSVVNPYIWPMDGNCAAPLTHANTPDHIEQVGYGEGYVAC